MQSHEVDGVTFTFSHGWQVTKFDDWSFYRNQYSRMHDGIKALDLLAQDTAKCLWLIEVKDYRQHPRTKPSALDQEVAAKIENTLAALMPARCNAISAEAKLAQQLLSSKRLRVVLHLEQPAKHSRLRPRAINLADVQQKLRQRLKPIDAHPLVTESLDMQGVPWVVE